MNFFPEDSALIIIDIINNYDFEHGKILANKTLGIVHPINQLKEYFKQHQLPVIYVNDHYNLWQADLQKIIKHCHNPLNETILKHLSPQDDDYFLIKPNYSAFYGTSLQILLNQLGVKSLVLTGIAGNICVLFTANDAYMRGYHLIIPRDCIASVDDKDQEYTLTMMENVLRADIVTVDKIV